MQKNVNQTIVLYSKNSSFGILVLYCNLMEYCMSAVIVDELSQLTIESNYLCKFLIMEFFSVTKPLSNEI